MTPLAKPLSGTFYRVLFAQDLPRLLDGAITPEGRFHHDDQPALYLSPTPDFARIAVATYLKPGDPARVTAAVQVQAANVVDLRDAAAQTSLGLHGPEPSVQWQPQRTLGLPATSWTASDAVRATGADGMIYVARSTPTRWHLVLFHWNQPGRASVTAFGPPVEFHP